MQQRRGLFWRHMSRAHGETRLGEGRTRCGQLLRHSAGCWTFLAMVLERRLRLYRARSTICYMGAQLVKAYADPTLLSGAGGAD